MVQLVILAHELSPLEGKIDQYTGFPTGVKNMWGELFKIWWRVGGGLSQYMGAMSTLPQFFREDFQQPSSIPPFIDKDKNKVSQI